MIDQEFLADRFAANGYGTSSGYAAALLALAESRSSFPAVGPRGSAMEPARAAGHEETGQSPLFQRVLMLLHCPFRFEAHAPRSVVVVAQAGGDRRIGHGHLSLLTLAERQCDRSLAERKGFDVAPELPRRPLDRET